MKSTKLLSLLLALSLLAALAGGCSGGKSGEAQTSPNGSPTSQATPQQPETPASLPLTAEKKTLTYWMMSQPFLMMYNIDMNTITYYTQLEKLTNVHMDITAVPIMSLFEQFNLMMASGEYTDLIGNFQSLYSNGPDEAIKQNVVINLKPYMDEGKMPNYVAALDEKESFWLDSLSNEGNIASANTLFTTEEGLTGGGALRTDWLEQTGMEVPTTLDELEQYLLAVKTKIGIDGPYYLYKTGIDASSFLTSAFDTIGWVMDNDVVFLNKGGNIVFGPTEEGYKEYLVMMNRWYKEGLVNKDFATLDDTKLADYIVRGQVAVSTAERGTFTFVETNSDNAVHLQGMANLKKTEDQKLHVGKKSTSFMFGVAVSTACGDTDLAIKWLDFCYSDQATLLGNYGVEGEALKYGPDGKPELTDLVLHNPEGMDVIVCIAKYTNYGGAMKYYADRGNAAYDDTVLKAIDLWSRDNDFAYILPSSLTFATGEKSSQYASIMGDIKTYVQEFTNQCIVGTSDPGRDWDRYVQTVKDMKIDAAVQLKAESLQLYNDKVKFMK